MKELAVNGDVAVPVCNSGLFYQTLLENSIMGIGILDDKANVKYCMSSITKILGYEPASRIGKNFFILMHPDDAGKLEAPMRQLLETPGKTEFFYARFRHQSGDWKNLEIRAVNMLDNPVIEGIFINYRDITEKAKLEAALRQSEERYRNMVENAQETIFVIDAATEQIVDFNENAVKLFGYSRPDLLKLRIRDLSPDKQPDGKNSLEKSREITREALRKGKVYFEWVHRKANGKTFHSEVHLSHFPPFDRKLLRGTVIDITSKKELEKKLREQEKDYKHLTAISPVGIFKSDFNGKCTYVNEKWCEMTGLSKEEAMGDGWKKAIHPDDRKVSLKGWNDALNNHRDSITEFRFQTPQGKTTWVYGHAKPDYDENGKFIGYVGSVTDVTEMVTTRDALSTSEQTKQAILNAIPDMLFRLSKSGTFLDYKAASGFGPLVSPEIFLGKNIKEVMPPDLARLCLKNLKAAFKTKTVQTYSYSLPDDNDPSEQKFFEARIVSGDEDAVALIRDITTQREAELALKTSEERWRTLVTSAPQYILTINKDYIITFINHVSILKPHQIIGKSVFKLLEGSSVSKNEVKAMLDAARIGKSGSLEFSLTNPLKEIRWYNVKVAPTKPRSSDDLIVMALDITERKKAEQDVMETNEKLKALYQRLETIREEEKKNIAMEIHDELGQELTAIKLGAFWLRQYVGQHKKEKLDIPQIQEKIDSLIELSGQTISSARKLAHQLRPVILDNLGLIPAIEWQVKTVNDSGEVKCDFRHNLGKVKFLDAFSVALFRIIQESLTNVLRHAKAKTVSLDLRVEYNNIRLAVQDDGIGIKASDIKQPGKIGIFGMNERAQNWKGKFEMCGKPGKGTLLKITFPLKEIVKRK